MKTINENTVKYEQKPKSKFAFVKELKKNYIMFMMLIPATLFFIIFNYLPMVGVLLAFKRYDYAGGIFGSQWIGFQNFEFLIKSGTLWVITRNTLLYNIVFIITSVFLQVLMAILISEASSKLFRKYSQTILFLPFFVSMVLVSAFVYNLFNFEHGTMNTFLNIFGVAPIDYYAQTGIWKYVLLFFNTWKGVGYGTIIYLATITGISPEYYEAAQIDGANKWHEIIYITLPQIKPTIIIVVLFAIGGILKGQFELFYQIIGNNGMLYPSTDIIDTFVYRMLAETFDIGMGTAAGLYQSFFGLIVIFTVNGLVKRHNEEYALF